MATREGQSLSLLVSRVRIKDVWPRKAAKDVVEREEGSEISRSGHPEYILDRPARTWLVQEPPRSAALTAASSSAHWPS